MKIGDFVSRWSRSGASERANKDAFLIELCDVLGVARPEPSTGNPDEDLYVFEKDIKIPNEGRAVSIGKADAYKHGCFLFEAKQGSERGTKKTGTVRRHNPAWHMAMQLAHGQALGYAKFLESPPPFIITCDIGWCFELYACFDGTTAYRQFPSPMTYRVYLSDLERDPAIAERLRTIFTDPMSLDPLRNAAQVTRDVAGHLAELAKNLEQSGKDPEVVAKFLMRCIFTLFAEDVGLLQDHPFSEALKRRWTRDPRAFTREAETLWKAMNDGAEFGFLGKLLHFNGGLFHDPVALPLSKNELLILKEAAECDWSRVEPAIFGTLLERALDPRERHKLGAHFTPRAYVERLVRHTIEEPVRLEWSLVQAEIRQLVAAGKLAAARTSVRQFHRDLCAVRVLDPACGTGNFLYVALDTLKRIEAEVLSMLLDLEQNQSVLPLAADAPEISPAQFLGLETKRWAKEIAELVLWIGYLQCHFRANGHSRNIREPVMRDYRNIENRDAILAWSQRRVVRDKRGKQITRWDGETMKMNRATGQEVPDTTAQVEVYEYDHPLEAAWPDADFIVGNPPYLGKLHFQKRLGAGYTDALRSAYADNVPNSCDLVMYWWHRAARYVGQSNAGRFQKRFGFITTKVIKQTLNRRVVSDAMAAENRIYIAFAMPDHPWVDSKDAASLRVAMSVGAKGCGTGALFQVTKEIPSKDGPPAIEVLRCEGLIQADLSIGAEIISSLPLQANRGMATMGPMLGSRGFLLTKEERAVILKADGAKVAKRIKPLLSGKDLTHFPRFLFVADLHGLEIEEVRRQFPDLYQHLHDRVFLVRAENSDPKLKKYWWLFRRSNDLYRTMVQNLPRFIATTETAKHRFFSFVEAGTVAEHGTVSIGVSDAYYLGVLSSKVHVAWALAAGGRRGVGDDPRYNKTRCFDPFPFPEPTKKIRDRIASLGEEIDAHRKRQQAQHPKLKLKDVYNVLESLRSETALTKFEQNVYQHGLVGSLKQLHDQLDRLVLQAYGWAENLTDAEILTNVVGLNVIRRSEERRGEVRYLREDFQRSVAHLIDEDSADDVGDALSEIGAPLWPAEISRQLVLVRGAVAQGRASWSADEVASVFTGATAKSVESVLASLAALGVVVRHNDNGIEERWKSADRLASTRPLHAQKATG